MNKKNLKYFKRLLSAQLQDLEAGADCNLEDLNAPDQHRADPIDQALRDIEDGEYGICDLCNEEIPIKRLKARPMARYCISCKGKLEKEQMLTGS
jgi:RNA polymerase-binding transcription factor DksA